MDRLLTDQEIKDFYLPAKCGEIDCVIDQATEMNNCELCAGRRIVAKTTSLVAQEIFKELEERCPHTPDVFDWKKRQCLICFDAIKSKWGIE